MRDNISSPKDRENENVIGTEKSIDELLGVVPADNMAESEFEIIDSGKVQSGKEGEGVKLENGEVGKEKECQTEKEEKECRKEKEETKMEEDEEAAMEAELLRRMEERNEEEEAVAALRMPTNLVERPSSSSQVRI